MKKGFLLILAVLVICGGIGIGVILNNKGAGNVTESEVAMTANALESTTASEEITEHVEEEASEEDLIVKGLDESKENKASEEVKASEALEESSVKESETSKENVTSDRKSVE